MRREYDAPGVDLNIEAYAAVMVELASAGDARSDVLARHGLDETRWDALDTHWQTRLSEALAEEGDGVPALVAAYSSAYAAAQRAGEPPISLEQFAHMTRLLHASGDVQASLAKVGITIAAYVRGSEHWTPQLATNPALEQRFREALQAR